MKKGQIFVISAPSGCGKTTVSKAVVKKVKNLFFSVSATTRRPRPGEKNRKDYFYMSEGAFKEGIRKNRFLEWEKKFEYFYGTPRKFALKIIKEGKDLLLSIGVKGAMNVKKNFPESINIFLKPPSIKELTSRLKTRNTDDEAEITKRIEGARSELSYARKYDYVIVNSDLDKTIKRVIAIIHKERKKQEG